MPTDPPPTTTPTPPGGEAPQPPLYRIMLLGNFTSSNGEDFSTECTEALGDNFSVKAAETAIQTNNKLGEDICNFVENGDVRIGAMSSLLVADRTAVGLLIQN